MTPHDTRGARKTTRAAAEILPLDGDPQPDRSRWASDTAETGSPGDPHITTYVCADH